MMQFEINNFFHYKIIINSFNFFIKQIKNDINQSILINEYIFLTNQFEAKNPIVPHIMKNVIEKINM